MSGEDAKRVARAKSDGSSGHRPQVLPFSCLNVLLSVARCPAQPEDSRDAPAPPRKNLFSPLFPFRPRMEVGGARFNEKLRQPGAKTVFSPLFRFRPRI